MNANFRRLALTIALAVLCVAVALPAAEPGPPPKLEPASIGSTPSVHRFGAIWLAGQPSKEDLAAAKKLGIRTVVNLRAKGEADWDEESEARTLGLAYENPGFHSPAEATDAVFDAARRALAEAEKGPLLLHCASGNRVGAVWLTHRVLDDGLPEDEALREAETVGLKSAELREKARDYVERHRAPRP